MNGNFSLSECEKLITKYINFGGICTELSEGCLGLGTIILHGAIGKKTVLIQEYYINEWTSGHKIRLFSKLPKKYAKQIEQVEQSEE